jgi:hypothetical protein
MTDEQDTEATTRLALELLRAPFEIRHQVGRWTLRLTQDSILTQLLDPIPLIAFSLGFVLTITNQSKRGTASHLLYEVGALLMVISLLLLIANREARKRHKHNEDAAKTFRRSARISLGVLGVAVVVLAFWIPRQSVADVMVTTGVAAVAAVALDTLIFAPAVRLYAFNLAASRVVSVAQASVKLEKATKRPRTLIRYGSLRLSLERHGQLSETKGQESPSNSEGPEPPADTETAPTS